MDLVAQAVIDSKYKDFTTDNIEDTDYYEIIPFLFNHALYINKVEVGYVSKELIDFFKQINKKNFSKARTFTSAGAIRLTKEEDGLYLLYVNCGATTIVYFTKKQLLKMIKELEFSYVKYHH